MSNELISIAKRELHFHGYVDVDFDIEAAIEGDKALALAVAAFRESFYSANTELQFGRMVSDSDREQLRVAMTEAAKIIADRAGADAVVLITYIGIDKKMVTYIGELLGGALAAGISFGLIQIGPGPDAITEVVLIDGRSGDLIWGEVGGGSLNSDILDRAMDDIPHDVDPDFATESPPKLSE